MVRMSGLYIDRRPLHNQCKLLHLIFSEPSNKERVGYFYSDPSADHLNTYCGIDLMINKKGADMGKVVKLSDAKDTERGPNSPSGVDTNDKSPANFSYRLFLIVNLPTFTMIDGLRNCLEAPSYGDVIRQAVRTFAIHLINNEMDAGPWNNVNDGDPCGEPKLKRMNIRIPIRTKERLDLLKERTGMTYTDIIVCGLSLLIDRARDEEELLNALEKGSMHDLQGSGLDLQVPVDKWDVQNDRLR